jgi:hypothetical protein
MSVLTVDDDDNCFIRTGDIVAMAVLFTKNHTPGQQRMRSAHRPVSKYSSIVDMLT